MRRWLRRWWWACLLVLAVVVRLALPPILRSQIETRASDALHAKVTVGDVRLSLLRGGVALEDVAVRGIDAAPDAPPLVGWKRFGVRVRFLPLFRKTVRLASIELVEPHLAVDRLQSGDLNLMALVPKGETPPAAQPPEQPAPAPETPPATPPGKPAPGWRFGVDSFRLERGGVRFRDLLVPGAEPVDLGIDSIEVDDVAIVPNVYEKPADIKSVVKLEQGALRVRARFTPREQGIGLDLTLAATRLPLHRSRVYVPDVAWSDLSGFLSLALRYRLETGGRNQLSGTVSLDDVTVWVAGLDEPALLWKTLAVALGRIDLAGHEARVDGVRLAGAKVPVRPRATPPLPLVAAAPAAASAPKAEPAPAPAAAAEEKPAPWRWSVGSLDLADTTIRLLGDAGAVDVGTTLEMKNLSGPEHEGSPVKLALAIGDGTLGIDGRLRIDPLGFAGTVSANALALPALVAAVGALPANVLQAGTFGADLQVALGSSAPTAGDVRLAGTTTLDDLWIGAADSQEFAVGAKHLAVKADEVVVPGALAKEGPGGRPLHVALASIDLVKLYAKVTRTDTGIVLPSFSGAPPEKTPPAADAKAAAADGKPAPSAAAAPAAGPAPEMTIESVKVSQGRIDVVDRTVKPYYWGALDPLDLTLERVRLPAGEIGKIDLHTKSATKGDLWVTGSLVPTHGKLEVGVKELALAPFNPYVVAFSPYSVSRGTLFLTTRATIEGKRYDTKTSVTLSGFSLASRTGQNIVLQQLGIPITVALALLRDLRGNIDLTVPIVVGEKGTEVDVGTVVTGALVSVLVGALTSPLKLVGAVLPIGGGAPSLAPSPVAFHAGTTVLDSSGEGQIRQLAELLAGRPGVGVTVSAPPTTADVRGLREQALLEQLGPRKGVVASVRNVGARGRIIDALTARRNGEEGKLDDDDAKDLDERLKDVPAPSAEQLKALGDARVALVEKELREKYGLPQAQVARAKETPTEPDAAAPSVRLELGEAGS